MKRRLPHPVVVSLVVCSIALMTASCSSVRTRDETNAGLQSKPQQSSTHQRIAQIRFGRDAEYAVCVAPVCPKVTPKSIAVANAAAPVLEPVAAKAADPDSLDKGEEFDTGKGPVKRRVTVLFGSGVSTLDADGKRALQSFLPIARQATKIVIMGRTDSAGSPRLNDALARNRALRVRDFLRSQMTEVDHAIVIDARGACCFVSGNDTLSGRRGNRRVEVEFDLQGQEVSP